MDLIKMGKFIADSRKAKGLTQVQLGNEFDITDKAVSKWERGENAPDISNLTKLGEILGVTVTEILNGEKNNNEVSVDAISYYSKRAKHKCIKAFILILTLIIFFFSFVYTINNYDKFRVYTVSSLNKDFVVSGYIVFNSERNILIIDNIEYIDKYDGTEQAISIENIMIFLKCDDEIIYSIVSENLEEIIYLSDYLNNKYLYFDEYSANNELILSENLNKCNIEINFIDKEEYNRIIVPLQYQKAISNNKLFY